MKNTGTEILNQVMNRWAANFRTAQGTRVMNEETIKSMGLFDLQADEFAVLREMSVQFAEAVESRA